MTTQDKDRARASKNYYKWKGEATKRKMALIARQALRIADLEEELKALHLIMGEVKELLVGISRENVIRAKQILESASQRTT